MTSDTFVLDQQTLHQHEGLSCGEHSLDNHGSSTKWQFRPFRSSRPVRQPLRLAFYTPTQLCNASLEALPATQSDAVWSNFLWAPASIPCHPSSASKAHVARFHAQAARHPTSRPTKALNAPEMLLMLVRCLQMGASASARIACSKFLAASSLVAKAPGSYVSEEHDKSAVYAVRIEG